MNSPDDERRINAIRFLAVDAVQKANSGHPGLPLGFAAAAYTLWSRHLKYDPSDSHWFDRDRFVLSAGHGSALLYALLHVAGYNLTIEDVKSFRQMGSKTPGHPEYHHTEGVEVTTGPLGQGFGNGVGLAMAEAHLAAVYNTPANTIIDHHTYVVAGDGDLMEGVASEAASLAGHMALGKLIVLYDDNKVSLAGNTDITFTEDVRERFEAYGWQTIEVGPEHSNDVDAIDKAIAEAKADTMRPTLIAIRSTIGFGSPEEGTFKTHGEPLGADNMAKTRATLHWDFPPFEIPADVYAFWNERAATNKQVHADWDAAYTAWKAANTEAAATFERARDGKLPSSFTWPTFTADNGSVATRESGGVVMNAIAASMPELVGGSADLDPSTKTYLKGMGDFQPGSYAGRNFHYGVREHAMAAASNGIALHGGLVPFCATFFNFVDYLKPSLRLAAINEIREVFVFTHDSVFLGEDGPTHQPIEQLAMLRATPNVSVLRPADALEVLESWKLAIQPGTGPWCMILSRQKVPFLGERHANVAQGGYVIKDAQGTPDLILIATGSEVALALDAAKLLEAKGTRTRVVSMPCVEQFEKQDAAYKESVLPDAVRARMSIEAGATYGWDRYTGRHGLTFGIDHFGTSAPAAAIAKDYGFTPDHIAELAAGLLAKV